MSKSVWAEARELNSQHAAQKAPTNPTTIILFIAKPRNERAINYNIRPQWRLTNRWESKSRNGNSSWLCRLAGQTITKRSFGRVDVVEIAFRVDERVYICLAAEPLQLFFHLELACVGRQEDIDFEPLHPFKGSFEILCDVWILLVPHEPIARGAVVLQTKITLSFLPPSSTVVVQVVHPLV